MSLHHTLIHRNLTQTGLFKQIENAETSRNQGIQRIGCLVKRKD